MSCASLCLIDPLPYGSRNRPSESYLMSRASSYDFALSTLLLTDSSLAQAVALEDISTLRDLEHFASEAASDKFTDEIS